MEEFRWMINESIRVGIERNLSSLKSLNGNLYHYLSDNMKFLKLYVARAIVVAKSKLRGFRKARKKNPDVRIPYYKRPYLIVDKKSYKIIGTTLLIGVRSRQPYVRIPLNHYTMQRISEYSIRTGTITIAHDSISISITKVTDPIKLTEFVGIDTNLNNITAAHSDGIVDVFSDVSKITKIKERYRKVKSHFRRNDVRIRRKIFQKYGIKQQRKTKQILHNISKKLVTQKKQLILEDLKGMRKLYRKGNGQGKKYHSRLNGWPFYEFRRQLEYKSKWYNGISVIKIKPNKTSSRCSICGGIIIPEENRQIRCHCGHREDRDINAARNILYKGVSVVQLRGLRLRPDAPQDEAMKQSKDTEQIVASVRYVP
ncbi:MAG: RNA-guided endonuclease InsQ/TnpB family protein [Nitrososphaerota archaeon]